jgi:SpoVK/Ycf46/Vps4 family AAA+-type ATPase
MLDLHAEIVCTCPNPPVLFLNECDQFLQSRGDVGSSASRMYNQMQNLLLEGLERMRGIMIATTNLTGNMDDAFSRRFHLKLEFPKPDLPARIALWQKHILPTIPRAGDVDVDSLAELYQFTGGQIAVVVRNAAVEAAVRGDMLRMSDLLTAAKVEMQGVLEHSPSFKEQIGFHSESNQRRSECRTMKLR